MKLIKGDNIMSYFSEWKALSESEMSAKEAENFWKEYFEKEKKAYEKILEDNKNILEGKYKELSEKFEMDTTEFAGFLDGINSSLKTELKIDKLKGDSSVKLDIDFEKLFFNMHKARADWLYGLSQWKDILDDDTRKRITKEYNMTIMATSNKVGRNDPCPCGSGKKYKKCCGK